MAKSPENKPWKCTNTISRGVLHFLLKNILKESNFFFFFFCGIDIIHKKFFVTVYVFVSVYVYLWRYFKDSQISNQIKENKIWNNNNNKTNDKNKQYMYVNINDVH